MKWAVSNEALDALGQHIVAVCGGDVVDYKVAYG